MFRNLTAAMLLLAPPAFAEVKEVPTFVVDNETYALYTEAIGTGDFAPFINQLDAEIQKIYTNISADEQKDGKQLAKSAAVGGTTLIIAEEVCKDSVSVTGEFAVFPCAASVAGAAIVNAIAQPIIFSNMEGHTMVFVANGQYEDMKWNPYIAVESGHLTHKPASHTLPGRSSDGVTMGVFVFEKKFGLNGEFAVMRFENGQYPEALVGVAAPYHDKALITSKSKAFCHFTNSGRKGQDHMYDAELAVDKKTGVLGNTNTAVNARFDRMGRISCRLNAVDKWANTLLVNLGTTVESNVRHGALYVQQGNKKCPLVPIREQGPLDFDQTVFPVTFDCKVDLDDKSATIMQIADKFWGRVGPRFCAFGVMKDGAKGPNVSILEEGQRFAGYDCGSEPVSLDVRTQSDGLRFLSQIETKDCFLTQGGGAAVFDCDDQTGAAILPSGFR